MCQNRSCVGHSKSISIEQKLVQIRCRWKFGASAQTIAFVLEAVFGPSPIIPHNTMTLVVAMLHHPPPSCPSGATFDATVFAAELLHTH
jgi:hypothetical protein